MSIGVPIYGIPGLTPTTIQFCTDVEVIELTDEIEVIEISCSD